MDLEQAKAAWQREKLEFMREKPLKERAADIRRKAMEIDLKFKREQQMQLSLGVLCLILLASQYDSQAPFLSNLGLGLMVLFGALGLASFYVLQRRFRESRPELPRREYLAQQRRKILARIQALRLNVALLMPPALFGLVLWQAAQSHSKSLVLLVINLALVSLVLGFLAVHLKIRRQLRPIVEEIDQELNHPD